MDDDDAFMLLVLSMGELTEEERRELELEENLHRKDLTAAERSKTLVDLASAVKKRLSEDASAQTGQGPEASSSAGDEVRRPGPNPKPDSRDRVAQEMGVSQGHAQGELSLLEQGVHVLDYVAVHPGGRGKHGGVRQYAKLLGKKDHTQLVLLRMAAMVFNQVCGKTGEMSHQFLDKAYHLAAIHKAPRDTWGALATTLIETGWTVDDTEKAVKRVNALLAAEVVMWCEKPTRHLVGFRDKACLRREEDAPDA